MCEATLTLHKSDKWPIMRRSSCMELDRPRKQWRLVRLAHMLMWQRHSTHVPRVYNAASTTQDPVGMSSHTDTASLQPCNSSLSSWPQIWLCAGESVAPAAATSSAPQVPQLAIQCEPAAQPSLENAAADPQTVGMTEAASGASAVGASGDLKADLSDSDAEADFLQALITCPITKASSLALAMT